MASESWKVIGKPKGPGIPAPSGQYRVGCVDLMHRLEGDDDHNGLLVRLHYPTGATPGAGYSYSSWYPHPRYIQGYMEFEERDVAVNQEVIAKIISKYCFNIDSGIRCSTWILSQMGRTNHPDPKCSQMHGEYNY